MSSTGKPSPYEIQYEIYKSLPPGYSVVWDRWFPRPYTLAFTIGKNLDDGQKLRGGLVFTGVEVRSNPYLHCLINARFNFILRSFRELDPSIPQPIHPTRLPLK